MFSIALKNITIADKLKAEFINQGKFGVITVEVAMWKVRVEIFRRNYRLKYRGYFDYVTSAKVIANY